MLRSAAWSGVEWRGVAWRGMAEGTLVEEIFLLIPFAVRRALCLMQLESVSMLMLMLMLMSMVRCNAMEVSGGARRGGKDREERVQRCEVTLFAPHDVYMGWAWFRRQKRCTILAAPLPVCQFPPPVLPACDLPCLPTNNNMTDPPGCSCSLIFTP